MRRYLFAVLLVLAATNLLVFGLQRTLYAVAHVRTASMAPTLEPGDRVLVRRLHGGAQERLEPIDRGDLVVLRAPELDPDDADDSDVEGARAPSAGELVVKRVIGMPGEAVQAGDGVVAIDDSRVLQEPWLTGEAADHETTFERERLAADELWVLGDARDDSIDSRAWGPVRAEDVVGIATYRIWPIDRRGSLER